jgi:hypothetical protein
MPIDTQAILPPHVTHLQHPRKVSNRRSMLHKKGGLMNTCMCMQGFSLYLVSNTSSKSRRAAFVNRIIQPDAILRSLTSHALKGIPHTQNTTYS